jgi:hypothetical protein
MHRAAADVDDNVIAIDGWSTGRVLLGATLCLIVASTAAVSSKSTPTWRKSS